MVVLVGDAMEVNVSVVLVLLALLSLDLLLRYFVTGNLESIALDAALLSWVYSVSEGLRGVMDATGTTPEGGNLWNTRAILGLLIFAFVGGVNVVAARLQSAQVAEMFNRMKTGLSRTGSLRSPFIDDHFQKMVHQYALVALLSIKPGKRGRRDEIAGVLNDIILEFSSGIVPIQAGGGAAAVVHEVEQAVVVTPEELLLPRYQRLLILAGLVALGTLAVLIPATRLMQ